MLYTIGTKVDLREPAKIGRASVVESKPTLCFAGTVITFGEMLKGLIVMRIYEPNMRAVVQ